MLIPFFSKKIIFLIVEKLLYVYTAVTSLNALPNAVYFSSTTYLERKQGGEVYEPSSSSYYVVKIRPEITA